MGGGETVSMRRIMLVSWLSITDSLALRERLPPQHGAYGHDSVGAYAMSLDRTHRHRCTIPFETGALCEGVSTPGKTLNARQARHLSNLLKHRKIVGKPEPRGFFPLHPFVF